MRNRLIGVIAPNFFHVTIYLGSVYPRWGAVIGVFIIVKTDNKDVVIFGQVGAPESVLFLYVYITIALTLGAS
jgi:hypothetical protein